MKQVESKANRSDTVRNGQKVKNDIFLIAGLLAVVLVATLAFLLFRTEGNTVTVTVNGQIFGEYSLRVNQTVEIRCGDAYNLLVIEDGRAYVKQASCPDGICSSHRPIQHDGESIVCLPNKVVVEIRSQEQNQPDIIS